MKPNDSSIFLRLQAGQVYKLTEFTYHGIKVTALAQYLGHSMHVSDWHKDYWHQPNTIHKFKYVGAVEGHTELAHMYKGQEFNMQERHVNYDTFTIHEASPAEKLLYGEV